jgi:transcriptional regulator with XRE-family HTH domain
MYGERLRYIREKQQLTQQQLADRCRLHKQQIYKIENNLSDPVGETIKKLAKELQVSSDYLLGLIDEPSNQFEGDPLVPEELNLINAYRHGDWREAMRIFSKSNLEVRE